MAMAGIVAGLGKSGKIQKYIEGAENALARTNSMTKPLLQDPNMNVPTTNNEILASYTMKTSKSDSGFQKWLSDKITSLINMISAALGTKGTAIARGIGAIIIICIVIVLIVFLVMGGMKLFGKKKKSRRSAAYKKKSKKTKTKKSWYREFWSKISGFKNPLGTKAYGGLPREIENGGRCDNINWLTINNGTTAMCVNASFKKPDPVRFTIDPTNLYEYELLPNTIKSKIRTNTGKLSITIPYRYNVTPSAYVLDFSNATYEDNTPANELFNDLFDFDYWNFKTKTLNKAPSGYVYRYESKFRPHKTDKNYKGLDNYV